MLSVFLACDDPYETARFFVSELGWQHVFATPSDSDDRLACVRLADAEVMLGTAAEQFLRAVSRDHRGAGVTVYITVRAEDDIAAIHDRHHAAGVVTEPLSDRPWGQRAFDAVIGGYRFLIAAGS
jgi:uncharacterized glyoxalase superfamily protein PhnB